MNPVGVRGPRREETQPCLVTMPPEMVCKILVYLKDDPWDVLNLSMTCTKLCDLLQKEEDLSACRLEESIPLVMKWLEKEDILHCREICKRVRKAVDKALDHIELISPLENLGLFPRLIPPKAGTCDHPESFEWCHLSMLREMSINAFFIDCMEDLEGLRRDVEERKIRTVVTKSLRFDLTWTEDDDNPYRMDPPDYLDKALALLNLDLLRLNIHQRGLLDCHHEDIDDPRVMYDIVRRLMSALPNLRCLFCDNFPLLSEAEKDAGTGLQRFIAEGRSLPQVPLERLSICDYPVMATLLREIARAFCGTLRELVIWLWRHVSESEAVQWQEEDYHFPRLLKLLLRNVTLDWEPILGRIHADNLKLLSWSIRIDSRPSLVTPVTLVVRTVQRFPSLVAMRLRFELDEEGAQELPREEDSVALEALRTERHFNLKSLEVENYWRAIPLQFLAGLFPNLETISVTRVSRRMVEQRDGEMYRDPEEDVRLGLGGRLEESALWRQLPKLYEFRFEDSLCTRSEAEAFRNRPA